MKVLNLYAGIGGNRKLWEDVEVTAVELDPQIAKIYQSYFPNDNVIVGDAHQYLLDHYKEFDFIWASPPCPTHSRMAINFQDAKGERKRKPRYPDMKLYQEIIFLNAFFNGMYCVENVTPYYEPLIKAYKIGRHLFWANFKLGSFEVKNTLDIKNGARRKIGFDLSGYKGIRKDQILNNCVEPKTGLYILNCARNIITKSSVNQMDIF